MEGRKERNDGGFLPNKMLDIQKKEGGECAEMGGGGAITATARTCTVYGK